MLGTNRAHIDTSQETNETVNGNLIELESIKSIKPQTYGMIPDVSRKEHRYIWHKNRVPYNPPTFEYMSPNKEPKNKKPESQERAPTPPPSPEITPIASPTMTLPIKSPELTEKLSRLRKLKTDPDIEELLKSIRARRLH